MVRTRFQNPRAVPFRESQAYSDSAVIELQLRQFTPPRRRTLLIDVRDFQCNHGYCRLELGRLYAEPGSEVSQRQKQARHLRQRGRAALLHLPSDHHPLRRLVRDTLEYEHSVEIFDHCRDLLYTDYSPV
jgi:hypothetical protein